MHPHVIINHVANRENLNKNKALVNLKKALLIFQEAPSLIAVQFGIGAAFLRGPGHPSLIGARIVQSIKDLWQY